MSFFFFFKQRTAYEMRISDWSSDVCSSDLALRPAQEFDALDVVEIGIEDRRIAVGGDRQFVDIDGDRALEAGTIAVGVDAARREIVEILRRPVDDDTRRVLRDALIRSEEHTSELQSLMRISYAVFCLKKKKHNNNHEIHVNNYININQFTI